ncbi:MAG: butyrate kinase, partial [Bacteroidales bacterium]|nr:butyrate kinase [Bacteroidales bacterium]
MKGNILVINTGSTTTKLGYYSDGTRVFDEKLEHTASEVAKYKSVMDQSDMRRQAIKDFMGSRGIPLEDVDIVMARGGLITPVITGVYNVNQDMRDVLFSGRDGVHACNLSAI